MKAEVYNLKAKKVGTVELPDRLFGYRWNIDLVHQALRTQVTNNRANTASTKGRGEVRGGGRKPWRQKGLGRARHGSIRSPIWRGGGVTHGPTKERIFRLKLNKKMRQGAIFAVLSRRLEDGDLKIIDSLEIKEPKTKQLKEVLEALGGRESSLLITEVENKNIKIASKNLGKVKSISPHSLNVYDLLKYKRIFLDQRAIEKIDKHYHAIK